MDGNIFSFVGVIIILRPTTNIISEGSIFALIGAVMFAVYLILTRYVSRQDSAITSFFWTGIGGTVTMSIISLFIWNNIPEEDYLWLLIMCLLNASSHFMMVIHYRLQKRLLYNLFLIFNWSLNL